MKRVRNAFSLIVIAALCLGLPGFTQADSSSDLQTQIDADNQEAAQLNQEIAQYEAEIQQADADKSTLQKAINALNLELTAVQTQVKATQTQINATQLQIKQLGSSIASTQSSITTDQNALAADLRTIQQTDDQPLVVQLFSASSFSDAWQQVDTTVELQNAIGTNMQTLQGEETTLAAAQAASQQKKQTLQSQQNTLTGQQKSLAQTTKSKTTLLSETSAKESNYEKLLAAAKAQLASFSTFAANAGGSGLLTNQTDCDSWGCYYNQRDVAWGNDPLDNTQYLLKSDGCLVTSMAMVMTHYGYRDVTPVTINADPGNFAAYYPAYLLLTITVDGMTVTRKTAAIDATLATGNPVIVGLYAYGGTHFVVLTSGSKGNYLMRDPYVPNAKDVSFTAHYSLNNIFGITKVVIS